jgi:hypothetical protein
MCSVVEQAEREQIDAGRGRISFNDRPEAIEEIVPLTCRPRQGSRGKRWRSGRTGLLRSPSRANDFGQGHLGRRLLMARRYKDDALVEAVTCADQALEDDDWEGAAVWRRILNAIERLQATKPDEGEHVN